MKVRRIRLHLSCGNACLFQQVPKATNMEGHKGRSEVKKTMNVLDVRKVYSEAPFPFENGKGHTQQKETHTSAACKVAHIIWCVRRCQRRLLVVVWQSVRQCWLQTATGRGRSGSHLRIRLLRGPYIWERPWMEDGSRHSRPRTSIVVMLPSPLPNKPLLPDTRCTRLS